MRAFWKYFITLLVGFLSVFGILMSKDIFAQTQLVKIFHILSDAFFVVGVTMSGFGLLIFVSNEGAFNMMVYGVRSFFDFFRKNITKKYPTFYDYQTSREDKKLSFGFILICGLFFLAVSVIMYLIYLRYI